MYDMEENLFVGNVDVYDEINYFIFYIVLMFVWIWCNCFKGNIMEVF